MVIIDPDRAVLFLEFVKNRHTIWERRQAGLPQEEWTDDPVLSSRKFTNVYRWLDPGSQFVINDLLKDEEDLTAYDFLARCFLYRHTNRPEVWRAFEAETGSMPLVRSMLQLRDFLHDYKASGGQVFSGAYMIYPQSSTPGTDKIDSVIGLTMRLAETGVFTDFLMAREQHEKFKILRSNKGVGDFMSMQILTDYGYGIGTREDEFVVLGPGARKGAAHLLDVMPGSLDDVHRWAVGAVRSSRDWPLGEPSMMDVQNCLCEFSKYFRFFSKPDSEKPYVPQHHGVQLPCKPPPKWETT